MTVSSGAELFAHRDHPLEIDSYNGMENVTIECRKCHEVLIEFDDQDIQEKRQLEAAELLSEMTSAIFSQVKKWEKKYKFKQENIAIHVYWMSDGNRFYNVQSAYAAIGAYFDAIKEWGHARLAMELDMYLTGDPEEENTLFSYG